MVLLVLVLLIDDYSQPTYSVPYSHIDPFATLQQRSSSSRTLLKRRALFCPRCAFFCSFVSLPRAGPWESRASLESRASRCFPRSPVVLPSAASSSATTCGRVDIKNLSKLLTFKRIRGVGLTRPSRGLSPRDIVGEYALRLMHLRFPLK